MRAFIFIDRERRLLERWLTMGEEANDMPRIFTWIRRNTPQLLSDLKLVKRVITELKKDEKMEREGRRRQRVQLNVTARLDR